MFFIGNIPNEIYKMSSLEVIDLRDNSISGSLPNRICDWLPRLSNFILGQNKLNGEIPTNLGNCSELEVLELTRNEFRGFIPKEIGNLTKLQELYLASNNLEGRYRFFIFYLKFKDLKIF